EQTNSERDTFLIGPDNDLKRPPGDDLALVERLDHFDSGQRAQITIEIPSIWNGINVGAEQHGSQFGVRAGARSPDVAGRVNTTLEPRAAHPFLYVGSTGHIGI